MSAVQSSRLLRVFTTRALPFARLSAGLALGLAALAGHAQLLPDWTSGNAPLTSIVAGATLNITTTANHDYNTTTITNSGTINWQNGSLRSGNGGGIVNQSGATFNDNTTGTASLTAAYGGTATFSNFGAYKKLGAGSTTITQVFDNHGSVLVSNGSLTFSAGGSASSVATFTVDSGASLNFNTQTHTLAGGASFAGAGATNLNGGTLTLSGGTVSFSNLNVSSGTLGGAGTAVVAALTHSGGTLSAAGLSLTGASTWSSGNWNTPAASTAAIATGASLTASGTSVKDFNYRTITNHGTFNFTGGQLRSGNGGGIVNAASGTFNDSAGGYITQGLGGTATFTNTGTYHKTASALSDVQMPFASTGSVTVSAGTLQLSGGGNSTGTVTLSDAAARLRLTSNNFEFGSGSLLHGPGAIEVSGATTSFVGTITGTANLNITGGTASVSGNTTLGGGTFSGGTFNGPGTLTFANPLTLSGTTLTGAGTINADGGLAIAGAFTFNGSRSLNVSGASTWSAGYLYAGGGSALTIKPGATLTTSFDGTLNGTYYGGGASSTVVENQGTFVKSAGSGTTDITAAFNNAGTISVQSGTLDLGNGGNHTGTVTLASGTTLAFTGGNHTVNPGAQINGTGNLRISGGNTTFSGANTGSANLALTGGTATFNGTTATTGGGTFSGGTLNGTGTLTLSNPVTLSGTTLTGPGALVAQGGAAITNSFSLLGNRTLTLGGNSTWSSGYIYAGGNSVVNIPAGAHFTTSIDGTLNGSYHDGAAARTQLNNQGTFTKSAGAATSATSITASVNNSGTINVQAGTLQLGGGGTHTGTVNVSPGATLELGGGDHSIAAGAQINGTGNLRVSSGTATFSGANTGSANIIVSGGHAAFNGTTTTTGGGTLSGGTLGGTGTLTLGNTVSLSGTTLTGAGILNAHGGVAISGSLSFNGTRTLNLSGPSTWTNAYIYGGGGTVLNNLPGAMLTTTGNSTLHGSYYSGGITTFNNQGNFTRSGADGRVELYATLNNTGTVNAQTGVIDLRSGGANTGTLAIADGARIDLSAGNLALNAGTQITGPGTLQLSGGTATVNTTVTASGTGLFSSGALDGPGTLTFSGLLTLAGAQLTGTGLLHAAGGAAITNNFDVKNAHTLTLAGNSIWSAGTVYHGLGAILNNTGNLTNTHNGNLYHYYGGAPLTFNNSGTFTKSTATGITEFNAVVHNTGTLAVEAGTLELRGGGTNSQIVHLSSGTFLAVDQGAFTFTPTSQILGTGTVLVSGGTAHFNGAATATAHLSLASGTASFTGNTATSGGGTFSGGTLTGPGNVQFGSELTLRGSTVLAGSGTVHAAGGAHISDSISLKDGQTLTLGGNSTWSGGTIYHGTGSALHNVGHLTTTHTGSLYHYYGGDKLTFNNAGTFTKSTATGTSDLNAVFVNTGTVNVQSGTLDLAGGGSSSGPVNVASGATLQISGGLSVSNAAQLAGSGQLRLTGGTLTLSGNLGVATFNLDGGRLAGTHALTGIVNWNSGNWNATAAGSTTSIASGATLNLGAGGVHDFNFRTIENLAGGTVYWNSGYLRSGSGGAFVNRGNFHDRNASSYSAYKPSDFGAASDPANTFRFVNHGTYTREVGGISYFDVPFDNHGTLNLAAGEIQLRAGGTMGATSLVHAGSGTHLYFTDDYTLSDGARFTGANAIFQSGGTLTIDGALQAPVFNWQGGNWNAANPGATTSIAAGTHLILAHGGYKDFNRRAITVDAGGTVTWQSGYLRGGDGSVFTNHGTFLDQNASSYSAYTPGEFGGTFRFVNRGTYTRDVGGTSYFDVPFDNHGTLNLAAGQIQLRAGGTMAATSLVNASSGTHLYFTANYTLESGAQLSGPGSFIHSDGTLSINGALRAQSFNWSGGNWNASSPALTSIASGTLLTIDSGGNKDFNQRSLTIDAGGTVNWQSGYLRGGSGSVFTNHGTFQDRNSSSYGVIGAAHSGLGGTFTFVNHGTYVRDVGGTTYFTAPFNNHGTLDLVSGSIELQGGGSMASTSLVNASTGARLYFESNYAVADGARFTGAGSFIHLSGTLTIDGALRASSFSWSGGNWNAPTAGLTTTIASGTHLVIEAGGNKDFNRRTLAIAPGGTLTWQSGYLRSGNGGGIVNQGTFHDQNASSYEIESPSDSGHGGSFTFTNVGTYNKTTPGTTRVEIPFSNSGTLNLHAGTMTFAGTFTNTGAINLAANATANFPGALTFGATSPLGGTGTVNASSVTAGGIVAPGNSAGKLTITGALTLLGTSDLLIELAGYGQGTGYDFLNVGGAATIAGDLQLSLLGGFRPALPTDTFTIVSAASLTGAFANIANGGLLVTADGGGMFRVNYGLGSAFATNSVVLSDFQAIPEPSTYALLGLGSFVILYSLRRRRQK